MLKIGFKTSRGLETDISKEYDTIILATGRYAKTNSIGLENLGVKISESSGKVIPVEEYSECTGVDGIYVVGDALHGAPELTPTAVMSGVNVANQVYNKLNPDKKVKTHKHNYKFTATTIFSYPEYSACGYTEAEAIKIYGEENVNIYHSITSPLEESLKQNEDDKIKSYFKLVCTGPLDEVVGMHYLGLNAGEVMQGFSVSTIFFNYTKINFSYSIRLLLGWAVLKKIWI
jgi:thioredoxin reductase (NADPH)